MVLGIDEVTEVTIYNMYIYVYIYTVTYTINKFNVKL